MSVQSSTNAPKIKQYSTEEKAIPYSLTNKIPLIVESIIVGGIALVLAVPIVGWLAGIGACATTSAIINAAYNSRVTPIINKKSEIRAIENIVNTRIVQQATLEAQEAKKETQQSKKEAQRAIIETQQKEREAQLAIIKTQQATLEAQQQVKKTAGVLKSGVLASLL